MLHRASEINHCSWHFNKQLLLRMFPNEHRRDHQISLKEAGGYKAACCVSQERRSLKVIVKQPPSGVSAWVVAEKQEACGMEPHGRTDWPCDLEGVPCPAGVVSCFLFQDMGVQHAPPSGLLQSEEFEFVGEAVLCVAREAPVSASTVPAHPHPPEGREAAPTAE